MSINLSALNTTGYSDLIEMVQGSLNLIIALTALIAVISLVYSGFQYILSAGDEDKAGKAQKNITYTLVGLVVVFISPLVIRFVLDNVLGKV
jgi:TRAP-type C4-dicarboxylate transport system permease small subunit